MPSGNGWTAITVDQIERVDWRGTGIGWHAVRRALDVNFVGVAAFTAQHAGDVVVEPHVEIADGRGQQEVYIVMHGAARFVIDDTEFDASAGTLVRVDPQAHRRATATTADTTVLALGGEPTFKPSSSEWIERARPHLRTDPDRAAEIIAELREALPGDHAIAVGEALLAVGAGKHDHARSLVTELVTQVPQLREVLKHDPDLRPLLPS